MIGTDLHERHLLHIFYIFKDKRSYQNMSIRQTLGFSTLDLESFHKEQNTVKCQFLLTCSRFCGFMVITLRVLIWLANPTGLTFDLDGRPRSNKLMEENEATYVAKMVGELEITTFEESKGVGLRSNDHEDQIQSQVAFAGASKKKKNKFKWASFFTFLVSSL